MAKQYEFEMYGQPSLYTGKERKLKVYFSEPESGITKETGILLFLAGFGGNSNSNVYKKMRNQFADKYNLVTIQCDYFGWEFMQSAKKIKLNINKSELNEKINNEERSYIFQDDNYLNRLIEIAGGYNDVLTGNEILDESLDNYSDMGQCSNPLNMDWMLIF